MASTFSYTFEELPLVEEKGRQAALINGEAEIAYTRDVWDFTIKSISLDSWSELDRKWKPAPLDEGNPIYSMVYDRLEHSWSEKVQEAIREQLAEDHVAGMEWRAEQRAELSWER